MKGLGGLLVLLGILSVAFSLFDYEHKWLTWINNWGDGVAWGIRIGFIVVGGVLWMMARRKAQP